MDSPALRWTAVALVIGLIADVLIRYSRFPGYAALMGLGGCVLIVVVSKWLGRFLSRPEDLYPDDIAADLSEDLRG